jgi:4-hydroxybenzoate polyprenyltransferase
MFFAGRLSDTECWLYLLPAVVSMCLASSAIYCVNDIIDKDEDCNNPHKCMRPIASGSISIATGIVMASILVILAFLNAVIFLPHHAVWLIVSYVALNIVYCAGAKKFAIIDVMCIGISFVLRLFIGGEVANIWISQWLVCLTFLLAIFLTFAKRRDDVLISATVNKPVRESSRRYNLSFLNQVIGLLGAIIIVCYILYTMQPDVEARFGTQHLYLTAIFVLCGILRYLQITMVDGKSGEPSKVLLHDFPLQCSIVLWLISFIVIIYL